jgi:hypothetical protein
MCGFVLLLCMGASELLAQAAEASETHCVTIHVRLNGRPIDGPQTITLKTKEGENAASLDGNCFRIPPALLKEKTLDVSFTLPGNKVYLSSIPIGFFAGPWDVDLADRRFEPDVSLPKHARVRDVCVVSFHVGEPETGVAMTPCRTPLPQKPPGHD